MDASDESRSPRLTDLIRLAAAGSFEAKEILYQHIYDDLRAAARRESRNDRVRDLQTTDLVNEVLLRFEHTGAMETFANRRVLFAVAIRAMRQILIDTYRKRRRMIDSPDRQPQPLPDLVDMVEKQLGYDVERLELALRQLETGAPRQYDVVTHRFFGGMTNGEVADLLGVSLQTVERDWKLARAKLFRWMQHGIQVGTREPHEPDSD